MKVVVIGGGPGGYVAAIRAAQLGAEVTLVEKENLGGTCLNKGCIPTKALLQTAEVFADAQKSADFGVNTSGVTLDFAKAQTRKQATVNQLVGGVGGLMKANKITVVNGTASFVDKDTIAVDGKPLPFDKIILATGSVPTTVPISGIDSPRVVDSTGALEFSEVPASMVIIGGGVIGVEFGHIYSTLGADITIVEAQDEILPFMDMELAKIVRAKLEKQGVKILTKAKVVKILDTATSADVEVEHEGSIKTLGCEKILMSVGRKVNTAELNLDAAGISHENGRIIVDKTGRTNVPSIYAIGDCTGGVMLAHVASVQGEIAAENIMGHKAVYDEKTNPACVYTNPELAGVGMTEEQAKAQGIDYIVGRFPFMANGKALVMGSTEGMVKVIAGKRYGEVLGVHIAGPRATDMIAQAALAIKVEATLDEIVDTICAHPTVAESVREATLAAYGRAIHVPNR